MEELLQADFNGRERILAAKRFLLKEPICQRLANLCAGRVVVLPAKVSQAIIK